MTDFYAVIYCIPLVTILLIRTFERGRINTRRVQGAIVAYLPAGLIICLLYHAVFLLSSMKSFKGLEASHRKEFLYFSFCTLTTAGYGDILPVSSMARSLSNL